jgi:hypothetical protein
MQYLLLIYDEEKQWASMSASERASMHQQYMTFTQDLAKSGKMLGGNALEPTHTATTVRVRGGKTTTTDGPFAETKEALGGYYLVEAANLDEAIAIAAKIPSSRIGSIEIRPIMKTG